MFAFLTFDTLDILILLALGATVYFFWTPMVLAKGPLFQKVVAKLKKDFDRWLNS